MISLVPDASREPDRRVVAAADQQLRVSTLPAELLLEICQQGEVVARARFRSGVQYLSAFSQVN